MNKTTFAQGHVSLKDGLNTIQLPESAEILTANEYKLFYLCPLEEVDNVEDVSIIVSDSLQNLTLEDSIEILYIDSFSSSVGTKHVYKITTSAPKMKLVDES